MTNPTPDEIDERNHARDETILEAARAIIEHRGISALTREAVAHAACLAPASVSNFGRTRISNGAHERVGYRERILTALMARAAKSRDIRMLRVGIADGCLRVETLPLDLQEAVG